MPLPPNLGKDRAPTETVAQFDALLRQAGFCPEERSWLNPVPGAHSLHLRDADCPLIFTNGKGPDPDAARASALGEMVERLATGYSFADFYLGPDPGDSGFVHTPEERVFAVPDDDHVPSGLFGDSLEAVYDPLGELGASHLAEFNTGTGDVIRALPFRSMHTDAAEPVWLPANLLNNLYASNGLSAGNTPEEAQVQGLAEIFERAVKGRIIAEGIAPPCVPDTTLACYPNIEGGLRALAEAGFGAWPVDASLGGRFPVMGVILLNPKDGGVFASFGAHPDMGLALERALTELLQGRDLDQLGGFPGPTSDLDEAADPNNLELHFIDSSGVVPWRCLRATPDHPFVTWGGTGDNRTDRERLLERLTGLGHTAYLAEFPHLGAYACRIVVPGLSEVYPRDELVVNNANEGARLRPILLDLPHRTADDWAALYAMLEERGFSDFQPVAELIGLAPEPGSPWQRLRVGELKALLALALDWPEEAREWTAWTLAAGEPAPERARLLRASHALLDLKIGAGDWGDYRPALAALFGEYVLLNAEAAVEGQRLFPGLDFPGAGMAGWQRHWSLLEAHGHIKHAQTQA